MIGVPGYWANEISGVVRLAVGAYLRGEEMTGEQIAAMRAYLRQWINAPAWRGEEVEPLRARIDGLTSREAIKAWLDDAEEIGIDPL